MQIDGHHLLSMNKVFSLTTNTMEGGVGGRKEGRDRGRGKEGEGEKAIKGFVFCFV